MSGTELFATFLGSVALLLWGVRMVRTGMTRAFGATLRQIVATSTKTSARSFFAAIGVTGLLQSSTATAILLAGPASDPFLGFFAAVASTWLMQSSLTMVLFAMALATATAIPLPLAFALVLGANVGGAIAPFSALIGSAPAGRRVAAGNLLM